MDENQKKDQNNIPCPECDTPMVLPPNPVIGKILECPACGTENEIINLAPLRIAPLEEEK